MPHTAAGIGQITPESSAGKLIIRYAQDPQNRVFLEVGTWNGHGSTKCFARGFEGRTDVCLYSLECNKDKADQARSLYSGRPEIHILQASLHPLPPAPGAAEPEWRRVDYENERQSQYFWGIRDVPQKYDVVLLDGGEETGWADWIAVRDKCRVVMLDDCKEMKNKAVFEEIRGNSTNWRIVAAIRERNGFIAAERVG